MRSTISVAILTSLTLLGCSQQLSEADSRVAFTAAYSTLSTGAAAAQSSASGTAAQATDTPAFRAGAQASVDFDYMCPGGGSARYVGSVTAAAEEGSAQATFSLATEFSGCKTLDDITIDGNMDYSSAVSGSEGAADVSLTMSGSLSFEGKVEGSCDLDVKLHVAASTGSAMVTYEGSVCGHDAAATLSVTG